MGAAGAGAWLHAPHSLVLPPRIQMCRQIPAAPSPFWEGCEGEGAGAIASLPKGHHHAPAAPSGSHLLLLAPVPSPSPKLRCI